MFCIQTNAHQCVIVFKAEEFGPGLFSCCFDKVDQELVFFFFSPAGLIAQCKSVGESNASPANPCGVAQAQGALSRCRPQCPCQGKAAHSQEGRDAAVPIPQQPPKLGQGTTN